MICDAHVHFFSHGFFQGLTGDPTAACTRLNWDLPPADPVQLAERWTQEMDRHGIARAALIASLPGDAPSVLAARAAFPERFVAMGMVNPLAAAPVEGLDAICLFPAMHRYSVAELKIPLPPTVFVHCGVLSVGVRKKLGLASPFDMRFSNPLDLHALALAHPATRFIVPHFGAGLFREALMLADLCPNVYLDTSSSNAWMKYEGLELTTVFRRALDVAGPQRLLFGSDSSFFPRGWVSGVYSAQKAALDTLGVSAADQSRIFFENFQVLFPPAGALD